jgi:hypothetical protein
LNQVSHIVHGVDERVNLFTVNRRDEGFVDGHVALMRDAISAALGVVYFAAVFVPQDGVTVIGHQIGKCVSSFDDAIGVLVEHDEKIALCGQQLSKQHLELLTMTYL